MFVSWLFNHNPNLIIGTSKKLIPIVKSNLSKEGGEEFSHRIFFCIKPSVYNIQDNYSRVICTMRLMISI